MVPYVTLKSLVDKFFLPRRARKGVKIGPEGRSQMQDALHGQERCLVSAPSRGYNQKKRKTSLPYFQKKKSEIRGGRGKGGICAPSAKHMIVPTFQIVILQLKVVISLILFLCIEFGRFLNFISVHSNLYYWID